jgi:hypothetical protein
VGTVYGVAQPLPLPAVYTPSGDVTCNSSTETTCITTGAINAGNPFDYYPLIWGVATIYLGGTAPSALVLAFKIGAGSDVDTLTVDPGQLVNSAKLMIPFMLVGANSASAWSGAGSTINITANATGQAVTFKQVGSRAIVALLRGPDA